MSECNRMNIPDRSAIVAHMGEQAVDELLALLAKQEVEIIRPPRTTLVMMPLIDSFLTDFNLGEVLVTEAMVKVDGIEGYGMVTGDNPRRVLARAVTVAILKGDNLPLRTRLEALLEVQERVRQKAHERERALTATTRVNFDLMAGA
jgi:alpha-D-ribose 1-methylphosphonate 5-triphosphate synthase subunit PhnG